MAGLKRYFYAPLLLLGFNQASASLDRHPPSVDRLEAAYMRTLPPIGDDQAAFEQDLAELQNARDRGNFNAAQRALTASTRDRATLTDDIAKARAAAKNVCELAFDPTRGLEERTAKLYCALEPAWLRTLERDALNESLKANSFEGFMAAAFLPGKEWDWASAPLFKGPIFGPLIKGYVLR